MFLNSIRYNKFVVNNLKLSEIQIPLKVRELIDYLSDLDLDIYLIGGFLRDSILNKPSKDLDFLIVDKDPFDLAKEISNRFNGKSFILDKETKTSRFVFSENDETDLYSFDFTSCAKNKIENDFLRRDFTFNALSINLKNPNELIDKFLGISDLKDKVVRAIKNENLIDDPLRILRAFRFAALINGEVESKTYKFIEENINSFNLKNIAAERISVEFWKILETNNSYKYLKIMSDVGLLEKIISEMTECRKVPPNDYHHLWLYDHSLYLVKTLEDNFNKIPDWAKEYLNSNLLGSHSPSNLAISKLGSILHDVGKPDTWEIKEMNGSEKHTFIGHEKVGEEITKNICEKLKFSNLQTKAVSRLVRYHLRPFQLSNNNEPISQKALYRFFRDVGEDTPNLLMLALADHFATLGPKVDKNHLENGEKLILFLFDEYKKYTENQKEKNSKPKLLDGNEIMEITGLNPSEELGELIKELDEVIGVGEIQNKEEAIKWVKNKASR